MCKILLKENINSKGRYVGEITITKLTKGVCRIEFNGTKGNELSESFFIQLREGYYYYIINNNLTFPNGIICAAERYVCLDSKFENRIYVFNRLKEKLINYFETI